MSVAVRFDQVTLVRDERTLLSGLDWEVGTDERWAVLGPNGSGKTTVLKLAGGQLHPSRGTVQVLGAAIGRVDLRMLRRRIGLVSGAVNRSIRHDQQALEIVVAAKYAALETWWDHYEEADYARARQLLAELGGAHIVERPFAVISEGERQQVLLARALMGASDLLLLDEPFAGLDLGARERLLQRLSALFTRPDTSPTVLVTHHAEEIPLGTTHVALLRDGQWVTRGPIGEALTSEAVSEAFDLALEVRCTAGRWSARAQSQ